MRPTPVLDKNNNPVIVTDEQLIKTRIFQDLPTQRQQELFDQVRSHCKVCTMDRGVLITSKHERKFFFYVILNGYVSLHADPILPCQDQHFLGWYKSGQAFFEFEVFDKDLRVPPEVRPTEKDCMFLEFPVNVIRDIAKSEPIVYRNMAWFIIDKMGQDRRRAEVLKVPRGPARLAAFIFHLTQERGYDTKMPDYIDGSLSDDDIGAFFGVSSDAVKAAFTNFPRKAILRDGDRIKVLDETHVKSIAMGGQI